MAGYRSDFSMSNNAYDAYQYGKAPYTKWTKQMIFDAINDRDETKTIVPKIEKFPLGFLRAEFLISGEWHHTSAKFNRTDFYELDMQAFYDSIYDFPEIESHYAKWRKKQKKKKAAKTKAKTKPLKHGTLTYYVLEGKKSLDNYVKKTMENVWVRQEGRWMVAYESNEENAKVKTRRLVDGWARPSFVETPIEEKN